MNKEILIPKLKKIVKDFSMLQRDFYQVDYVLRRCVLEHQERVFILQ